MTTFLIDKIVRDKVYDRYKATAVDVAQQSLTEEEILEKLKEKLLEESEEVLEAQERHHIAEELGDILEVIESVASRYGITTEEILAAQQEKKEKNGDFANGTYVYTITLEEDSPMYAYHKANEEKYPKI